MRTIGTCRLCLQDSVELVDSHIQPKWVYKRIRGTDGNPNPVQITRGKGHVQTSRQVTELLMCEPCDNGRIGKLDNYVSRLVYQKDGSLPIMANFGRRYRAIRDGEVAEGAEAGALDVDRICRFAISVFWRAHISTRPECKLQLGPYGDVFRRYLLGEVEFPKRARLLLYVFENASVGPTDFDHAFNMPASTRVDGRYRHVDFLLCGLQFNLALGSPEYLPSKSMCLHHSLRKLVFIAPALASASVRNHLNLAATEILRFRRPR